MKLNDPAAWLNQKKLATELNYHIGNLLFQKGIELMLFRNSLNEVSISEILRLHDYAEKTVGKTLDLENSTCIAKALTAMNFIPSKIDLGKLNDEWSRKKSDFDNLDLFLKSELKEHLSKSDSNSYEPVDVILYGFGRIGRLCARAIISMTGIGAQLRLRAIVTRSNDPSQLKKRADLFRLDSVHGPFVGVVDIDTEHNQIIVNGEKIQMIAASDPAEIDYTQYGIKNALVIDNTGVWRNKTTLSQHCQSKGVSKVLLTAPGKEIPNIVYGVNHQVYLPSSAAIWSAASCTTNAIAPILDVVEKKLGIEKGHIETIHAYTNDQNLLDNMHKKERRGRSAAVNMVITETGAAAAASKVIPSLEGKFTGSAVRVPTPNGSLAILTISLNRATDAEEVKSIMKKAALEGTLRNQIKYSYETELVSSDIVGNTCCSVFDAPATRISNDGKNIVLYIWYDNEYGYTQQVVRLAKYVMEAQRKIYD